MSRFFASLGASCIVGYGALKYFTGHLSSAPAVNRDDFVFFRPDSINDRISDGLRTGDLLLFQRGMPEKFSARSVLSFLTRGAAQSPWDHVAVVVRDRDPKNNVPYVLEAGVNGVSFRAFDERVLKSQSSVIAMRRLNAQPDISRELIAMELAQNEYRAQRFRVTTWALLWNYLFTPSRGTAVKDVSRMQTVDAEIQSLTQSLSASSVDDEVRRRRQHVLEKRVAERAALESKLNISKQEEPSPFAPSMGDIDLVVDFYQNLGILPPFPQSHHYTYVDFVHETGGKLPVADSMSFSAEVYIKSQ